MVASPMMVMVVVKVVTTGQHVVEKQKYNRHGRILTSLKDPYK